MFSTLGIKFPENSVAINFKSFNLHFQQNLSLYVFPKWFIGKSIDDDMSNYCNDVSECLTYLCEYYMVSNLFSHKHVKM